jgi:hypothetical protein
MERALRNAEVTGYHELISRLQLPDADVRHVLAAAIHAQAHVIVKSNLKDFPHVVLSPHGISAQSPNDFLVGLTTEFPQRMLAVVREQADRLRRPPVALGALIQVLEQYAPGFGTLLRELEARDGDATAKAVSPVVASDDSGAIARMLVDMEG